jgi:hypothetical protein
VLRVSSSVSQSRRLTIAMLKLDIWDGMDVERIIDDIEQLQEMFEAPISGRSAQATSGLRIEGMMKCSRIARGSVFGEACRPWSALSEQSAMTKAT